DIALVGSRVDGTITGDQLYARLSLLLRDTEFKRKVQLNGAKIDGDVDMDGATFREDLEAYSLRIGAHLLMGSTEQNKGSFSKVDLSGTKVGGNVEIVGADLVGNLRLDSLQVGAHLLMRSGENNR